MNLQAEFVNWAAVDAALQRALMMLDSVGAVGKDISQLVAGAVRDEAPEGLTGKLKAGIDWRILYLLPSEFESEITSEAFHTKWVIDGRGPVRPVRAKSLHWKTKGGEDVFAMYARATSPNPFHERAWRNVQNEVRQRWLDYTSRVAQTMVVSV